MRFVSSLLSVVLVGAVLLASGCSWLRGASGYERAKVAGSLEIPPDLDQPAVDPSMAIPEPSSAVSTVAAPATGESFVIADSMDSAWRRLGLALDRLDGVVISDRAQALSAYSVKYGGEEFLVKVAAEGDGARISAVSTDGRSLASGAAGKLLGLLRNRLG